MIAQQLANTSGKFESPSRLRIKKSDLIPAGEVRAFFKERHGTKAELRRRMNAAGRNTSQPTISRWMNGQITSHPVHLFASYFMQELQAAEQMKARKQASK